MSAAEGKGGRCGGDHRGRGDTHLGGGAEPFARRGEATRAPAARAGGTGSPGNCRPTGGGRAGTGGSGRTFSGCRGPTGSHQARGLGGGGGGEPADERDRQQALERGVEVGQFEGGGGAVRALFEVTVQLAVGARAQAATGVGAEPVGVPCALAFPGERAADVGLEVCLAQPFAGAVREDGGGVGCQAEQRGDLAGRLVLDGGVPEHGLPPLGQGAERPDGHGPFGLVHGPDVRAEIRTLRVGRGSGRADREHGEVLDELLASGGVAPGGGHPSDRGEQVGAHSRLGAAPAANRLKRTGEDLAGEVLRGVRVPAAGAGVAPYGRGVPAVHLLVRAVPSRPDLGDQLGVREVGHAGRRGLS